MPQFNPSEEKVALATFPVAPAGLECAAELWLASNGAKVATSGEIPFISTGLDQAISLPVTMPGTEGTYPVYLDVFSGGVLIQSFRADEDVVIAPARRIASCVYCGAPFTTESDLVAHMETNHPGKPYIVWASLPEENVLLTPGGQYSIEAKVFAPPTTGDERWIFAFWSYRWECIAGFITIGGGTPAGFYIGEAASYHCYHRLGRWYCPSLGENIVYSDCYLAGVDRWYSNPVWKSVDIGLRVTFLGEYIPVNLLLNPSFEADPTGGLGVPGCTWWTNYPSRFVCRREDVDAYEGLYSASFSGAVAGRPVIGTLSQIIPWRDDYRGKTLKLSIMKKVHVLGTAHDIRGYLALIINDGVGTPSEIEVYFSEATWIKQEVIRAISPNATKLEVIFRVTPNRDWHGFGFLIDDAFLEVV